MSDGSFAISIFRESPFFIYKLSGKNISVISGNFKSVVTIDATAYMIRDRAPEFFLDYNNYGIKDVCTSVKAPNMNSIAERFIGSVRREALDYFLILNKKQLKNILTEYIDYYNSMRPHQGIGQCIPDGNIFNKEGIIKRKKILGGLHSHYYRDVA